MRSRLFHVSRQSRDLGLILHPGVVHILKGTEAAKRPVKECWQGTSSTPHATPRMVSLIRGAHFPSCSSTSSRLQTPKTLGDYIFFVVAKVAVLLPPPGDDMGGGAAKETATNQLY